MKTLPYLKQITYAVLVLAFPLIFSAARDTTPPEIIVKPVVKPVEKPVAIPAETIKTIKLTLDSLKQTITKN